MKHYESYTESVVDCLGAVPINWGHKPLKHFARIVLGKMLTPEDKGNQLLKPYLRSQNIQVERCDLTDVKEMWFSQSELDEVRVKVNDLLVNEGGDVGRTAIWKNEIDEVYIQNSINKVTVAQGDPKYYYYHFQIYHGVGYFDSVVNRVSIPHLTKDKLSAIKFLTPPLPEQTQIVAYLDAKTAAIDDLIRKKEQKIALLKEYRSALINRAVTKGLDPNVPMKDSGVEWIGEVPGHWEFTKVKHQFKISGGGTPSTEKPEYWDGDIPWVSSKDMKTKFIHETVDYITETGLHNSTCSLIQPDALLIVVRSGILQRTIPVAINKVPLVVNQDQKVLISKGNLSIEFFYYFIIGNENFLLQEWIKEGTTVESIEMDYLMNFGFYYPSFSEQQQIVAYLDEQTAETDAAMELEQQKIALLKEYRQSLISSVVTGKIKVTDE